MYFCRGVKVPVILLTYALVSHIKKRLHRLLIQWPGAHPAGHACNGEASIIYGHELRKGTTL
jgi:hypothetical protein